MMIGENPEREHQCKICAKTFPSGRLLGGHMSCHVAKSGMEGEPPLAIIKGSEEARRLGHCLRANPKKSWKISGLMDNAPENPCPVRDKQLGSTRALFGHMKIHSRKEDESGHRCEDRGKGSGSMKPCRHCARLIHDRERLNLSLSSEDRFGGLRKTKGDLLLSVLLDDEAMHTTRRKRTPRTSYVVNERTEGVLFSEPNGYSTGSEAEQDLVNLAAGLLIMISRGEADLNSSALGIEHFRKSSAPDISDLEKVRITEASKYGESHLRVYSRRKRKLVELEVTTGMLCGAREVEHKKPKAARSGEEPTSEAAMADHDLVGTAGSDSRERAELWIEPGLNSYRNKVCAEESHDSGELGEENKYKSRATESYKQDAPVDASQGIEGNCGCTQLKRIKDDLEKVNRHVYSICHKDFLSSQVLGSLKRAHHAKNPQANTEIPASVATEQWLADTTNMVYL